MTEQNLRFVGARLREARDIRGVTATALSKATNIPVSVISSYERGRHLPPQEKLDALIKALNVKTEFLLRPIDPHTHPPQIVFERSRTSTTKTIRRRAAYKREWLREIVAFLDQHLNMPVADLPKFGKDLQWDTLTDGQIEQLACESREQWHLGNGPISNATLLMENHGIVVTYLHMGSPKLDAFSAWDVLDRRPYIIIGNDGQTSARTRFNICHELGHLVLHQNLTPQEWSSSYVYKKTEKQAHRFASAFLTPAPHILHDLRNITLNGLRMIKPKWKVSIKMLIRRAYELNLIEKTEESRLYANYNKRGWHREEPYDGVWTAERPIMLRRAFEALENRNLINRYQVPAALPFNQADIEEIAGLPDGYFTEDIWGFVDSLTADFPRN